MNRWSALALLLAIAVALALRVPDLGNRPLHNDEGVNATKVSALLERGDYKYDPHEYHGPTLHYFSLPFLRLSGASNSAEISDARLRIATVAFGVGLILLLLLVKDGLGNGGAAWTALLIAVSPVMVFYSRYFIHEMLLVFFTLMTVACGWRYWRSRKWIWAALTGIGVGLMFATKETFVLTLGAMSAALFGEWFWQRGEKQIAARSANSPGRSARIPGLHLGVAMLACVAVWLVMFTSFFTNAKGLADSVTTYLPWLTRAGGSSPHIHPWHFYFERLLWFHPAKSPVWTEVVILVLAAIGAIAGFVGNCERVASPGFTRFLSLFTVTLAGLYAVIPYKTPWCALNFWLGTILLAGIGAAALVKSFRHKVTSGLIVGLIGVGILHLAAQAWLGSQRFAADTRNPHVYAQTSPHARELVERVRAIAQKSPLGFDTTVKVISPESYWPLPWAFRDFKHIGWYEEMPADAFASVILASAKLNSALDDKSGKAWIMTGYYELRPNVFLELYVERGLWEKFVATLPRNKE
jgi:uncharacterized protein (TIGR03663 family)